MILHTLAGFLGAAAFLLPLSFLDCTQAMLAVVLLSLAVTISSFSFSGFFPNHMDIAPKFAGTLFGITNTVAASSGFLAPYVAAVLTPYVSRRRHRHRHSPCPG